MKFEKKCEIRNKSQKQKLIHMPNKRATLRENADKRLNEIS